MKKGILITPDDLKGTDWIARMKDVKLTTLGIHSGGGPNHDVLERLGHTATPEFRMACHQAGLRCEYEFHAAAMLLPPQRFQQNPQLFACKFMDAQRTPTANPCLTNPEAIRLVEDNAEQLARTLPSETHCYYFWGADSANGFCHCETCSKYSFSDLNLMEMNAVARGVRRADPLGKVACLVYSGCFDLPEQVEPEENIFFEFAPYVRCYRHSIADKDCHLNRTFAKAFRNFSCRYGSDRMQVLEYWLDSSLFSKYKKPAVKPPVTQDILKRDLDFYTQAGITDITTFAVYMDGEYFNQYGEEEVRLYAETINQFLPDN